MCRFSLSNKFFMVFKKWCFLNCKLTHQKTLNKVPYFDKAWLSIHQLCWASIVVAHVQQIVYLSVFYITSISLDCYNDLFQLASSTSDPLVNSSQLLQSIVLEKKRNRWLFAIKSEN